MRTLALTTGVSLRELIARLGHSSTRAALIYPYATRDRDKALALALGDLVRAVRTAPSDKAPEVAYWPMIDSPCSGTKRGY